MERNGKPIASRRGGKEEGGRGTNGKHSIPGPEADSMLPGRDRTRVTVGVVVAVAVLIRVVGLGSRPFHWDEARIGYWALRALETGTVEYRPVAGGPLVSHLARWALLFGDATDALARLPFALLSGLLPAAALLFRGRLRDDETVALALALGFSPLLVYYGRFLRGDVLAAGAALVALGFVGRWVDADRDASLYAATVAAVVALASSGFAVATAILVAVAGFVVLDHRRVAGEGETVPAAVAAGGAWLRDRVTPLARAIFVLLAAWGVCFAPRGFDALGDPVGFLSATYRDPVASFLAVRVFGREGTQFLPFVTDAVSSLLATAGIVLALGLAGFLADRYRALPAVDAPRPVVTLTAIWAGLGLIGYPVVAEVRAPWTLVHAIVPMTVPAAVGLAAAFRYGRRALDRDDAARAAAALLVLAAVVSGVGVLAIDGVYGPSDADNEFAQFGQPASDLEPLVTDVDEAVAASDDDRLVYVGERYVIADESATDAPPVRPETAREAFGERLPLPWYVERTAADTGSVAEPGDVEGTPAVLVVDPAHESAVAERFPEYETRPVKLALWNREVVVFLASE